MVRGDDIPKVCIHCFIPQVEGRGIGLTDVPDYAIIQVPLPSLGNLQSSARTYRMILCRSIWDRIARMAYRLLHDFGCDVSCRVLRLARHFARLLKRRGLFEIQNPR